MPERRILLLDSTRLSAYTWRQGVVALEQRFAVDGEGQAAFQAYLASHAGSLFHLLADLPDESFQQDSLPHASGADRRAMLRRKLGQYFFGTPFSLAQSLGRSREGRRDERFLFAALTRPQLLTPWLEALREADAILCGIYSPPQILHGLLRHTGTPEAHLILITLSSGGLRQSYFEDGQLRLSRLTPLTSSGIEEAAISTYGEAAKIHQYLVGQRLLARGQQVTVRCLASPGHFAVLRQSCIDTDELRFELHDLHAAAAACHLHSPLTDSSATPLLVHLLAQKPPTLQFADPPARLNYRRWQARTTVYGLALLLFGASLLNAAGTGINIYRDRSRLADAGEALQIAQQQYQALLQTLPEVPVSPASLRLLTDHWHTLQANSPALAPTLLPIVTALQGTPQVELQGLEWSLGAAPEENRGTTNGNDSERYLIIDIDARLSESLGPDRRSQSETIDRFAATLTAGGAQTRIVAKPFDTDPGKSLKAGNESRGGSDAPLNFKVRYWRRLGT